MEELKKLAATIVFIIGSFSGFTQSDYDKTVTRIQNSFGCSSREAEYVLDLVTLTIDEIQFRIIQIASSETDLRLKERYIDELLKNYFVDDATIQVSSLLGYVNTYRVDVYLENLKNVKKDQNYYSVELYFDPKYLSLGSIDKQKEYYEFLVTSKQYFRGCQRERLLDCYIDLTYKNFKVRLSDRDGKLVLKLASVTVTNTIPIDHEVLNKQRALNRLRWKSR